MNSIMKELGAWQRNLLQAATLGVLCAAPAFAAKGGADKPFWYTIYKMIPQDIWIFIAVFGIVGVVWLLFYRRVKDCKCKCGIVCKCDCKCSAACGCQIPVLKLKR